MSSLGQIVSGMASITFLQIGAFVTRMSAMSALIIDLKSGVWTVFIGARVDVQ